MSCPPSFLSVPETASGPIPRDTQVSHGDAWELHETFLRGSSSPHLVHRESGVAFSPLPVAGVFQPVGAVDAATGRLTPSPRPRAALTARLGAILAANQVTLEELFEAASGNSSGGGAGVLDGRSFFTFCSAVLDDVYVAETLFYLLIFTSVFSSSSRSGGGGGGVSVDFPAFSRFLEYLSALDAAAADPASSPELLRALSRVREALSTREERAVEARAAFERVPQPRQVGHEGVLQMLEQLLAEREPGEEAAGGEGPQLQQPAAANEAAAVTGQLLEGRGGQAARDARLVLAYTRGRGMQLTGQLSFEDVLRACGASAPRVVALSPEEKRRAEEAALSVFGGLAESLRQVCNSSQCATRCAAAASFRTHRIKTGVWNALRCCG